MPQTARTVVPELVALVDGQVGARQVKARGANGGRAFQQAARRG